MKRVCEGCQREYSDDLLALGMINGVAVCMCPLCYAEVHLALHGEPWAPRGAQAKRLFTLARKQYPGWEASNEPNVS